MSQSCVSTSPTLGPGQPCMIIGEVAQAHDGSLGMTHAYIDAVANAGAGAVKFRTHIASVESTPGEPWRVKFSRQDATCYDYWKRMEFTEEQWYGLKQHAQERGLQFLSSPFSVEAVELLTRVGVAAWKVASGEVSNILMFERMVATGLPILLSSGMSPLDEIDAAVELVTAHGLPPNPVDKNAMAAEMAPLRDLFTKSVVARLELPAGTLLQAEHLAVKKPGTGIPATQLSALIGRTLRCSVQADQLLQEADLV